MSVTGFGNPGTIDKYSGRIWDGIPIPAIVSGLRRGVVLEWDFGRLKPVTAGAESYWDQGLMAFADTGGTGVYFAGTGLDNGMTFSSDGDNEGAGVRSQLVPFKIARGEGEFAAEIELETSTIADTKHGFFWGLIENSAITATSPIAAAGTLADLNFVGFHRLEGDGDKLNLVYKANGVTQVTVLEDAVTLVADTPIRLGLTFRQNDHIVSESKNVFRWWVDGAAISPSLGTSYKVIPSADGTDFPNDIAMGPIFTLLNATATTPGNTTLHRMRYAQLW